MQCKICAHTTECILEPKQNIPYQVCSHCTFIQMDQEFWLPPEEEKARYALHNNTLENTGYVEMFQNFMAEAVTPYKSDVKTILDFGSGPNPVLATLLEKEGYVADYYDPYFAPQKVYESKAYDCIIATEVFEHVSDPVNILKLFTSHLKRNGKIALMTLFHPNDNAQFITWWYRRDPTHISFYTIKTFEYLAQVFNLQIVYKNDKNVCVLSCYTATQ